jgi:hypothetical protein
MRAAAVGLASVLALGWAGPAGADPQAAARDASERRPLPG